MQVKLLDSTLRDGGYINNWDFGSAAINNIEKMLIKAGVDDVECGFLTSKYSHTSENTLYNSVVDVKSKMIMINLGEYDLSLIPNDVYVRIAFKKHELGSLINTLSVLNENDVKFSLNPMHIGLYDNNEMNLLVDTSNKLCPDCVTAVDTMGILDESKVRDIFLYLDQTINPAINLGFHGHNNLGLAFNNAKALLGLNLDRTIVIDACVSGLGRGGGMLSTNIIAIYLNDTYGASYNVSVLDKISELYINKLSDYDYYPYYLTALNHCHPNYGRFLSEKNIPYDMMKNLLGKIPDAEKMLFNENLINCLYKENFLSMKEV